MSDGTKIQWTDATWPVVTGCTHISEGCENCYAARLTGGRLRHLPAYAGLAEKGRFNGTVRLLPDRLEWPLHWRKPRRIFVSDMADLFHADVPEEFIARVFAVMAGSPQHTFQVLTKRHARMRSLLSREDFWLDVFLIAENDYAGSVRQWPLPNVWLGVSAEDQHWADLRIPALVHTPAAVRFVSAEPLLGPVSLHRGLAWCPVHDFTGGFCKGPCADLIVPDWLIIGGESGPGARPMEIGWATSLIRQGRQAGMRVFMKQVGSVAAHELGPFAGKAGGEWDAFPDYLRVREFPLAAEQVPS